MLKWTKLWYDLYRTFNDDSLCHCELSFDSQHFTCEKDVKEGCKSFVEEIKSHGFTMKEIIELVPNATILEV